MKRVIVWSGGADSTLLLARALAEENAEGRETKSCVSTITLHHHQLEYERVPMRTAEQAARVSFMKWARRKGWPFSAHWARFRSNIFADGHTGQYTLWATHLLAYAGSIWGRHSLARDEKVQIEFGYIKRDIFWHFKSEFLATFDAVVKLSGIYWIEPSFPLEWMEKRDVLDELHSRGVPRSAWWTCEEPVRGKPCRKCSKCQEIAGWKPRSIEKADMGVTLKKLAKTARR